jgi:imidazolonepropionase-like amidohydrolase
LALSAPLITGKIALMKHLPLGVFCDMTSLAFCRVASKTGHKLMRTTLAVSAVFGLTLAIARAQGPQAPPSNDPVALTNANLINVRNGQVSRGTTIVLRNGTIEFIGTSAPPSGVRSIDLKGKYVLPGLIDAHTHISDLASARRALESGVTTARDAGVNAWVDVGLRELVRKGAVAGPDMIATGYWIRPPLPEDAFLTDPSLAPLMSGVDTPEAVRQIVRSNLAHGVDWIKVFASGSGGPGEARRPMLSEAAMRAAVEEASSKNVPVFAHSHSDEGTIAAVRAGVRCIEHGTYLSDATLALMKDKGVYFDPTYVSETDFADHGGDNNNLVAELNYRPMVLRLEQTIRRAHQMGLKVVAGTDGAYGPKSLIRVSQEVAAFVRMGFTPLEAIQSATILGAEMLKLEKSIGSIELGKEADLLVVDLNPLDDIWILQEPLLVVSNGRVALNKIDFTPRRGAPRE